MACRGSSAIPTVALVTLEGIGSLRETVSCDSTRTVADQLMRSSLEFRGRVRSRKENDDRCPGPTQHAPSLSGLDAGLRRDRRVFCGRSSRDRAVGYKNLGERAAVNVVGGRSPKKCQRRTPDDGLLLTAYAFFSLLVR
jgi:hypothetical protein